MGKIFAQVINNFSGGLSEDKRVQDLTKFSITKHFDAFTYKHKLVPYAKRETSNGLSGGVVTTLKLTRFLYARTTTATTFRLFALGDDGSGKVKLYKLDIDGTSNLDTENWLAATNGASSSGARSETLLFYYKGFLYTLSGTTNLNRFDVTEVAAWADGWQTLSTTTTAITPVHHPTDDVAYFFSDNVVYSLNNTTWNGAVLTLPTDTTIAAACAYGNYLAIACVTNGNLDKRSVVYLWDRDSSLTTLTERIDFGEGAIIHLANLDNKLIAVMSFYPNNAYALGKGRVIIKTPNGQFADTLTQLTIDATLTASDMPISNMVRSNKLYFPLKATLNGDTRVGIWVVDKDGKLTIDQIEPALDTHANASGIKGIYATANLWWISYDDGAGGAGAYSVTRTDNDGLYDTSNPAVLETLILNADDSHLVKKLLGVTVMHEPLPSGGQAVLKYRKDEQTSWTTILTSNTQNAISHDAVNIESSGANLPEYNEIQFRIESTGGAVITGIAYKAEVRDKQAY